MKGTLTEVVHDFVEEGNRVRVEETVGLAHGTAGFKLETRSEKIQAEGMASYLKRADLDVSVDRTESGWSVSIRNRLAVEKPWYAPGPLFAPVAREIAARKFEKLQARILDELEGALQGSEAGRP